MLDFLKKSNAKVNPSITRIPSQKIEKSATNGASYFMKYCEELQRLDQEFNSIHGKLNGAKNNHKNLQMVIQSRETKLQQLRTIINSIGDLSTTMQQSLNPTFSRLSELFQIYGQLSDNFTQNQNQIETVSNNAKLKENSLKELIETKTSLKTHLEQTKEEIHEMIQNIEIEKKQLFEVQNQHDSIETTIKQLSDHLENLNKEFKGTEERIMQSSNEFEVKRQKEQEHQHQISNIKTTISDTDQRIGELENSIRIIKSSIEEKKNQRISTHHEALDYERSIIPIKKSLTETSDKKAQIESSIISSQQEQNKIKSEIDSLKKQIIEQQQAKSDAEMKLQAQIMQQSRLKGENQASNYRLSEAEKNDVRIQNERKMITDEMARLKTHEMELKSSYVKKIGEGQQTFATDDINIRQLTDEINELKVKIDFIKNKQSANKILQKQIQKAGKNIQTLSSQIQKEAQSKPTIIPNLPNAKPGRRILEL